MLTRLISHQEVDRKEEEKAMQPGTRIRDLKFSKSLIQGGTILIEAYVHRFLPTLPEDTPNEIYTPFFKH